MYKVILLLLVSYMMLFSSGIAVAGGEWTLMYRMPYKDSVEYKEFQTRKSCVMAKAMLRGMFTQQLIAGGQKDHTKITRIINSRVHCIPS